VHHRSPRLWVLRTHSENLGKQPVQRQDAAPHGLPVKAAAKWLLQHGANANLQDDVARVALWEAIPDPELLSLLDAYTMWNSEWYWTPFWTESSPWHRIFELDAVECVEKLPHRMSATFRVQALRESLRSRDFKITTWLAKHRPKFCQRSGPELDTVFELGTMNLAKLLISVGAIDQSAKFYWLQKGRGAQVPARIGAGGASRGHPHLKPAGDCVATLAQPGYDEVHQSCRPSEETRRLSRFCLGWENSRMSVHATRT